MYRFEVMELYSLRSRQPSYGILASVLEKDTCTYVWLRHNINNAVTAVRSEIRYPQIEELMLNG